VTSEEETKTNVPFGYLAVLLGYLCKSPILRGNIKSHLEGGSIRVLLIAIEEFLRYHRKIEEIRHAEGDVDLTVNFIGRLQALVDGLKKEEGLV
jgi:hypothetical protein